MPMQREEFLSSTWRDGIFDKKVLFCTGGAGTICSAQTRAFVALGGNACIIGRNVEKTEKMAKDIATARSGAKVLGIGAVDVRDPKALQDAADRCAKDLGGIDFCIAGAAGNFLAPMAQLSANAFKTVIDIDALGSYNTAKATLPYLVESAQKHKNTGKAYPSGTGGRIIFVSATFHYTGMPLQAHVSAAKAAVDALMGSVCLEYGPYGVTSNVIAPGPIKDTEGMERLSSAKADQSRADAVVPQGRWGYIRDIADSTVYLFSDAGSFVNGQAIPVDGGAWRRQSALGVGTDEDMRYPEFLLKGEISKHVKSGRKPTSKM